MERTVYRDTFNNLAVKESDFFQDTEKRCESPYGDIIYVASQFKNDDVVPLMIEKAKRLNKVPYYIHYHLIKSSRWYVFVFPNGVKYDGDHEFQRFTVIRTNWNEFRRWHRDDDDEVKPDLDKVVDWEFIGRFYVEIESKKNE